MTSTCLDIWAHFLVHHTVVYATRLFDVFQTRCSETRIPLTLTRGFWYWLLRSERAPPGDMWSPHCLAHGRRLVARIAPPHVVNTMPCIWATFGRAYCPPTYGQHNAVHMGDVWSRVLPPPVMCTITRVGCNHGDDVDRRAPTTTTAPMDKWLCPGGVRTARSCVITR